MIYGGSGGGSSAIVTVNSANPAQETVLVIAGGGGGAGVRGTADDSRNTSDHKRDASWEDYSYFEGGGGDSSEYNYGDGKYAGERFEGYRSHRGYYYGEQVFVYGGKGGFNGEGGKGSEPAELPAIDPFVFKTIEQTPVTIRTMSTTGGVGGDGMRAHGADGVAAYGYAYSTHKFYDDADASEYAHAVSGYAVSPGGGAGYGGGSSGGVLALGMQKYDEYSGEVYAIGMGVTMGGGGSGGSYVSPDLASSYVRTADMPEPGYMNYDFCFVPAPDDEVMA